MRHSASTGSPKGPRTRARRTRPPRASSVPSPPSATGTSSQSHPAAPAAFATAAATAWAVAVPRNLSGAASTRRTEAIRLMVARVAENVVIVSNRGPLSFSHDDAGKLVAHRGAGGVASSLAPLVRDTGASWMAAAMSDADREAAAAGPADADGFRFRIPDGDPDAIRILPDDVAGELLAGMASYASCGFHAHRWARNFEACCQELWGWTPSTFVSPLAPDHDDIDAVAESAECTEQGALLDEALGGRRLILRVDRIELSKNLLRGFLAYEELLRTRPEWRAQVVFAAFVYPSSEGLPEYLAYRQEVETLAARINNQWGVPGWTPILLDMSDNFPRSVAALRRYDLLLVNPVRDGLNLVAKEGPLLNDRHGVLALSREAGAWEELGGVALEVNPFDVAGTSDVLAAGLAMDAEDRVTHAAALRKLAAARTPRDWLDDQLAAAAR